jgi:hypothetical protein
MGTSLNFASIAPSQVVGSRRESALAGMGEFLATLMANREQLAQSREQLKMQREKLDADKEIAAIEKKKLLTDIEQKEKLNEAQNIVLNEALPKLTLAGFAPEAVEEERVRLIQTYGKKLGVAIGTAFNEGVSGAVGLKTNIDQGRTARVNANVGEKTAPDVVAQAGLGTQRGRIDVETARIQNATAKLDNDLTRLRTQGYDVQKLSEARTFAMTSGLPWGRVAKEFGLPLKAGGLAPDFVFPVAEDKDATKAAADAQTASDLLSIASAQLTAMPDIGVGTAAYTQLTTEKFLGIPVDPLAPAFTSDKEKQLVGPYATITTNLVKLQHGARGTNFDAQQTIRQVVVRESDPAKTKADKRLMIQLLPIVFRASASGDPVAPRIKLMLDAAQKRGVDDNILAPFRALQKRYEAQEKGKPRGRGPDGVAVDPDDALIDAFAKGRP